MNKVKYRRIVTIYDIGHKEERKTLCPFCFLREIMILKSDKTCAKYRFLME